MTLMKRKPPASKQARIEIARGLFEAGRKEEAIALYYDIYQTDPNDLTAVNYAGAPLGVEKPDESVAILEQYTKHQRRVRYYVSVPSQAMPKDFQPARDLYKTLMEMRPDLADFSILL